MHFKASPYAGSLYDAVYLYALVLSRVINESGTSPEVYRDGNRIAKNDAIQFEGSRCFWFYFIMVMLKVLVELLRSGRMAYAMRFTCCRPMKEPRATSIHT